MLHVFISHPKGWTQITHVTKRPQAQKLSGPDTWKCEEGHKLSGLRSRTNFFLGICVTRDLMTP
jgi:hypothetical protein